jgi:hypothetical protein
MDKPDQKVFHNYRNYSNIEYNVLLLSLKGLYLNIHLTNKKGAN